MVAPDNIHPLIEQEWFIHLLMISANKCPNMCTLQVGCINLGINGLPSLSHISAFVISRQKSQLNKH